LILQKKKGSARKTLTTANDIAIVAFRDILTALICHYRLMTRALNSVVEPILKQFLWRVLDLVRFSWWVSNRTGVYTTGFPLTLFSILGHERRRAVQGNIVSKTKSHNLHPMG
jgi:hypothetical protein